MLYWAVLSWSGLSWPGLAGAVVSEAVIESSTPQRRGGAALPPSGSGAGRESPSLEPVAAASAAAIRLSTRSRENLAPCLRPCLDRLLPIPMLDLGACITAHEARAAPHTNNRSGGTLAQC